MKTDNQECKMTIEEAFSSLDELIKEMEDPEITLEESFNKYNKGLELVKYCNSSIDKIEHQLTVLEENVQ